MKLLQKSALQLIRLKLSLMAVLSPRAAAHSAFRLFCTPQVRNLAPPSDIFINAEQLSTRFNDTAICGYRWNKGGTPRVLVLHGFESSVVNFEPYIAAFAGKKYEVLVFDAPAHGRSGGKRINALQYRDFIHFIQREFGPATAFVAHSFGGLALSMMVAETENNGHLRMALIAPLTRTASTLGQYYQLVGIRNRSVKQELENIIGQLSGHDVEWFSLNRALHQINSQVLWVHDRTDLITPFSDLTPIIKENYPNITFVIKDGLGHRRIYRDPGVLAAITSFI